MGENADDHHGDDDTGDNDSVGDAKVEVKDRHKPYG